MATPQEIDTAIAEYRRVYPPLISILQAAEIAHRKPSTIYGWSSAGLLDECKRKRGNRVLFDLEGFVRYLYGAEAEPTPPSRKRHRSQAHEPPVEIRQ